MSKLKTPVFSSRWTMMLAMLGMAVGTGNIWRFPRIAAKNGGGEFLIAWIVFLFLWSIPIILLEFGLGRKTRSGPVRTFMSMLGPRWAWMGAFVVFVTSAIMFYYSVVAGWTFRYSLASILGEIPEAAPGAFWTSFTTSLWPLLMHAIMIGLAVLVVARGVSGIEKVTKVLMPSLIGIILILTVRALFLPGAAEGLSYMFSVDWHALTNAQLWIEALIQNAWDTGAGWGLVLCYAVYLREREDTALNAFILPIGNNLISLLAGIMIFCTVFSIVPQLITTAQQDPSVLRGLGSLEQKVAEGATYSPQLLNETIFSEGNTGITFIWMPQLFKQMGFGQFFMILFFIGLAFAAFSSLIAMVEVAARTLEDAGMRRTRAINLIGILAFVMGAPSALWMDVLNNQDWVWGVGLMVSGLFFTLSIVPYGIKKFRQEQLNHPDSNIKIGPWWDLIIRVLAPLQMIFLIGWFIYQSIVSDPTGWWKPIDPDNIYNAGTFLFQFAVVLAILIAANGWIVKKMSGK
ncbi:MAG: sodium-dependent transporter [Bacteroidetes bacterium]|nr:MAG: sodium-dependent transporter [Bacteroidota bacterium]